MDCHNLWTYKETVFHSKQHRMCSVLLTKKSPKKLPVILSIDHVLKHTDWYSQSNVNFINLRASRSDDIYFNKSLSRSRSRHLPPPLSRVLSDQPESDSVWGAEM